MQQAVRDRGGYHFPSPSLDPLLDRSHSKSWKRSTRSNPAGRAIAVFAWRWCVSLSLSVQTLAEDEVRRPDEGPLSTLFQSYQPQVAFLIRSSHR